jgi:transmembrane sensor
MNMTSTQRIEGQAALWAVRLNGSPLEGCEQRELDEWLAADARHGGALLRAQAAWDDVDRIAALAAGTQLGGDPPRGAGTDNLPTARSSRTRFFAIHSSLLVRAAAAALLAAIGGHFYFDAIGARYSTPVGAVDTVRLDDGSQVTLNTDTQIHVRLKEDERRIELDRGEALFQVAKDPARPFVVHAGTLSVHALGTTFTVRNVDRRTDVTVTEGLVELVDNSTPEGRVLRRVAANEHATVVDTRAVAVQELGEEQTERVLAWREGLVKFAGEPLSEAVEQINRHNRRRIIVDDAALASRPVVGSFRANDAENFARTVAIALDARLLDDGESIHLRP